MDYLTTSTGVSSPLYIVGIVLARYLAGERLDSKANCYPKANGVEYQQ